MDKSKFIFKVCCAGLSYATSNGSDNESFGRAIHFHSEDGRMSAVGANVVYCPFCGKKVKTTKL